ncbi:glycerophosphodiester phosphodiesterase [Salinithrix halophila]|uniref:Glycerophosphodiester phosphodiesterase n=1 Tax=Salinithrix halophila TaxID=1485204 RepID=A0ABV8JD62_9BACL
MGRIGKLLAAFTLTLAITGTPLMDGFTAGTVFAETNQQRKVKVQEKAGFINVAHRGASGYAPENTLAAFDKAVKMRADYFELDVQRTKDGHLVLMHDNTVDRTTNGSGEVKDLTLKEIRQLDAGSWFSSQYAGEKVPTLEEVLDRYRYQPINILIELKKPELYPGIEKQVALMLLKKGVSFRPGKIIVQSFNHDSLRTYHRLQPWVQTGVLVSLTEYRKGVSDEKLREWKEFSDYVNPNYKLVDDRLVNRVHQNRMKILPYTIRSKATADEVRATGVDGFITDYPELGY